MHKISSYKNDSKVNKKTIFFRNDDPDIFTFGDKREMLFMLTDLFIEKRIPLVHAVIPGIITQKTVKYFNELNQDTDLLEFIQHGWKHIKYEKGEFDYSRTAMKQLQDIRNGRNRMLKIFGDRFFAAFSAPYGTYSENTFKILDNERFKVISSVKRYEIKNRMFNEIGRLFNRTVFFGRRISYHGGSVAGLKLKEISISVNIMQKDFPFKLLDRKAFFDKIRFAFGYTKNVGILLHHSNLKIEQLTLLDRYLDELKDYGFRFCKMSSIYESL